MVISSISAAVPVYGFLATCSHHGIATYNAGDTIQYDQVLTNIGGAYNGAASEFTCPIHGMYLFSFTIASQGGQGDCHVSLRVGSQLFMGTFAMNDATSSSSQTAIVECDVDQKVHIEVAPDIPNAYLFEAYAYGHEDRQWTSFSGMFIGAIN